MGPGGNGIEGTALLSIRRLAKSFGPTKALVDVNVDIRRGEVLAVMGENGSGKSTLIKILSGVHTPDDGTIVDTDGNALALGHPRAAQRAGLGTVFQEVLVAESRSILDNVWLGAEGLFRTIDSERRRRVAAETIEALLGRQVSMDTPVERLSLSDRQACSIARVLVRDPDILVLDEATSALDVATRDRLFDEVRRRLDRGKSTVFISHRMDEVFEIADRVTVMRSGETVTTLDRTEATPELLVGHMTGGGALVAEEKNPRSPGDVRLALGDFTVRSGEIVGLAGLEGHGQDGFLQGLALAGDHSVAYVPRDRRGESLFESKSILDNFSLPTVGLDAQGGFISSRRSSRRFDRYVDLLGITYGRSDDAISTLSGGNQQKVVIARWLATDPSVLLLNDPTRGIDLGAKRELYRLLRQLAGDGMAIVMLSTEVDELVELMDRVVVFREGSPSVELPHDELSPRALVDAFFGRRTTVDA